MKPKVDKKVVVPGSVSQGVNEIFAVIEKARPNTNGYSYSYLAGLLGVSISTLALWEKAKDIAKYPKVKRLFRLAAAVRYMKLFMYLTPNEILEVLNNGRVVVSEPFEYPESISVIGYLTHFPEEVGWRACLVEAHREWRDNILCP